MKILLLGNSFTAANNMPDMLAHLTKAEVVQHTRGGARLAEHLNPATNMGARTLAAFAGKTYDYVVLQEMSNGPITSTDKYLQNVALLCQQIREAGAEPVIYATWAYERDGKKLKSFGMDYVEMAARMIETCRQAAEENHCLIAEVGKRFFELADVQPLYAEDGCHPNKRGSEIAAEMLAEVILADWKKHGEMNIGDGSASSKSLPHFTCPEEAITELFGHSTKIISKIPVSGGDINAAYCLQLTGGRRVFLKSNTADKEDMFRAEAAGLEALRRTRTIGVPAVLAIGNNRKDNSEIASDSKDASQYNRMEESEIGIDTPTASQSFLLMEYLEPAPKDADYWEAFGRELALLHKTETAGFFPREERNARFGFWRDNYIGSTPQINTPKSSWIDFYRECRLEPQIRMAEEYLEGTPIRKLIRILDRLEELLREPEFPSLLHGDLWGGNQICGPDGKAWIIDPAVYVGDFEADLAMTELFGAFPEAFYSAYAMENPIEAEYDDRRDMYHLYHMLNHLNIFGEMYLGDVREIVERY